MILLPSLSTDLYHTALPSLLATVIESNAFSGHTRENARSRCHVGCLVQQQVRRHSNCTTRANFSHIHRLRMSGQIWTTKCVYWIRDIRSNVPFIEETTEDHHAQSRTLHHRSVRTRASLATASFEAWEAKCWSLAGLQIEHPSAWLIRKGMVQNLATPWHTTPAHCCYSQLVPPQRTSLYNLGRTHDMANIESRTQNNCRRPVRPERQPW